MKKLYITPELEIVKLQQMSMICLSDWIDDGEADEPAYAPFRPSFDEDELLCPPGF